ncbi:hypothetical protein GUITHDRAFT_156036 [Guillardia theta CCMP2712]|uniref:Uncharacterized protein n=3 Tax=Guillardia theta TaxID=55529 RepID=L1IBJ7_GUITC|nr:hypothetical protein GUITHDRAFT_156036 [Guillardia theta CCMP2712]EKX33457.1 hypothetical protein GUITHDRAFT_156036 [Guillardia theta CCMP2712]|eukprot:XP_005820437.1 hypothetical protein GUITHDRAFT_156036 [Guillardia theta CCMP2712]
MSEIVEQEASERKGGGGEEAQEERARALLEEEIRSLMAVMESRMEDLHAMCLRIEENVQTSLALRPREETSSSSAGAAAGKRNEVLLPQGRQAPSAPLDYREQADEPSHRSAAADPLISSQFDPDMLFRERQELHAALVGLAESACLFSEETRQGRIEVLQKALRRAATYIKHLCNELDVMQADSTVLKKTEAEVQMVTDRLHVCHACMDEMLGSMSVRRDQEDQEERMSANESKLVVLVNSLEGKVARLMRNMTGSTAAKQSENSLVKELVDDLARLNSERKELLRQIEVLNERCSMYMSQHSDEAMQDV